jgi:hypothetical protein
MFHYRGGEDFAVLDWNLRVQLVVLDKLKLRTKSFRYCVKKWDSNEEQLASSVGLQSTLSHLSCP